ncbi:hypothetical protein PVNG_06066 [Plasmodium vivax North Korean]|uniref:Variable surface protein n=1 Tax=Plasmodium vivax North Korean TaxID=1035514 RepID=A0A0J9U1S8_PLAVI|nr:hypothetical protein PVNG_06066 [Plasmodium vivax North Korean]
MNFDNLIKYLYYNFVSSYATYERIIKFSNDDITEVNTNNCNTKIFTEGCSDESFFRNCLIAKKYLQLIKKHETPFNIVHACKYLSYWAYQEVVQNSSYKYKVLTFLEKVMKDEDTDICKGHTEEITPVVFSEIQKLIELHKSLTTILTSEDEEAEEVEEGEKVEEDACQRNNKCVELYEGFKNTCSLNSDNPLCNEVENFRGTYNHIMYVTNKCKEFKYLPSYQKHSKVSSMTTPIVALSAISFVSFITYKVNNYFS